MKHHFKCKVSYDGSSFNGWQKQGNTDNTIQAIIEQKLSDLLKEPIIICGAGRTDAGVHAIEQCFDFFTGQFLEEPDFIKKINLILPDTIKIKTLEETTLQFHSRKSAIGKIYKYLIDTRFVPNVFTRKFAYHLDTSDFNIEAAKKAAEQLCGTHDFSSFTSDKRKNINKVRTINSINIYQNSFYIIFEFNGNGFLYNMVRIISGTLIEIGTGKKTPDSISFILKEKDRSKAGFTVPSHGLFLKKVIY